MISSSVVKYLSDFFHQPVTHQNFFATGGGCINDVYRLQLSQSRSFFCKINGAANLPHLFQKERNGLALIAQQNIIRTPEVLDCTVVEKQQLLLMQWVDSGERTKKFWECFGRQLAQLHQVRNDCYGLEEDNFMGSIPQHNQKENNWEIFFREHRLKPLVKACLQQKLITQKHQEKMEIVYERLGEVFSVEHPALLHGDLWSGNFICNEHSEPVLIDPACYFGHRSVDLGMTTLFGGFDKSFYQAYHYHFPLPARYQEEWAVCNLYPLFIHLLLFGKSYLGQIEETIASFV